MFSSLVEGRSPPTSYLWNCCRQHGSIINVREMTVLNMHSIIIIIIIIRMNVIATL